MPASPSTWQRVLDPADVADFVIQLGNGLLEPGEAFTSYTLALSAEAVALGLEVGTGAYAPASDGQTISVWFSIAAAFQGNAAYEASGVTLLMELTLNTNSTPARRWQRTLGLKVQQL